MRKNLLMQMTHREFDSNKSIADSNSHFFVSHVSIKRIKYSNLGGSFDRHAHKPPWLTPCRQYASLLIPVLDLAGTFSVL
jgi:hypothetical protein